MRLGAHDYSVHCDLPVHWPNIVSRKSSFLVSCFVITDALILFSGSSPEVGSISRMYDLLVQAAHETPVEGNQGGSYLTMKSNQGMVFGAASILSGRPNIDISSITLSHGISRFFRDLLRPR